MTDFKLETLDKLKGKAKVKAWAIRINSFGLGHNKHGDINLSGEGDISWDRIENVLIMEFNQDADKPFEYDAGYGTQVFEGIILLEDESWLERNTYDGSEWWEYKKTPSVDDVLNYFKS